LISCAAVPSYRPWLWEQNRQEVTAKVWQNVIRAGRNYKIPIEADTIKTNDIRYYKNNG